ncbi:MAG: GNAT family N-acetyltransferase [Ruminiclostridium sp.]|nr:GNAT family N-acetyltransferase [Ruminiclostridium sp.]
MIHCGTQKIETNRLILRRFVHADYLPMYNNWASDSEVSKFLTWPTHANAEVSRGVVADWVNSYKNADYYQWAIAFKNESDNPFGSISVVFTDENVLTFEVGYCIGKRYWRNGITSEALSAVIDFLFTNTDVNRIEAVHDVNNPNSGKVMKKCGMSYEGMHRQGGRNNTGLCDINYYSILKGEWESKREN